MSWTTGLRLGRTGPSTIAAARSERPRAAGTWSPSRTPRPTRRRPRPGRGGAATAAGRAAQGEADRRLGQPGPLGHAVAVLADSPAAARFEASGTSTRGRRRSGRAPHRWAAGTPRAPGRPPAARPRGWAPSTSASHASSTGGVGGRRAPRRIGGGARRAGHGQLAPTQARAAASSAARSPVGRCRGRRRRAGSAPCPGRVSGRSTPGRCRRPAGRSSRRTASRPWAGPPSRGCRGRWPGRASTRPAAAPAAARPAGSGRPPGRRGRRDPGRVEHGRGDVDGGDQAVVDRAGGQPSRPADQERDLDGLGVGHELAHVAVLPPGVALSDR